MDAGDAVFILKLALAMLAEVGAIGATGRRVNELFERTRAEGRDPTMDELKALADQTDAILDEAEAKLDSAAKT